MSDDASLDNMIKGQVQNYRETSKQTSSGKLFTLEFDVDVESPPELVGVIHVKMEGYNKSGTLENGNNIQFNKSESRGRNFITDSVENIDTLEVVNVEPATEPIPDERPIEPPDEPKEKKRSGAWYLLPIFFGIIGGIIAYFVIKDDDPGKAKNCLKLGIILTVVQIILLIISAAI